MHVEIVKGRRVFAVDLLFLLSSIAEVMCIKLTDIPRKKITQSKQIADEEHLDIASRRNNGFIEEIFNKLDNNSTEFQKKKEKRIERFFCLKVQKKADYNLCKKDRFKDVMIERGKKEKTLGIIKLYDIGYPLIKELVAMLVRLEASINKNGCKESILNRYKEELGSTVCDKNDITNSRVEAYLEEIYKSAAGAQGKVIQTADEHLYTLFADADSKQKFKETFENLLSLYFEDSIKKEIDASFFNCVLLHYILLKERKFLKPVCLKHASYINEIFKERIKKRYLFAAKRNKAREYSESIQKVMNYSKKQKRKICINGIPIVIERKQSFDLLYGKDSYIMLLCMCVESRENGIQYRALYNNPLIKYSKTSRYRMLPIFLELHPLMGFLTLQDYFLCNYSSVSRGSVEVDLIHTKDEESGNVVISLLEMCSLCTANNIVLNVCSEGINSHISDLTSYFMEDAIVHVVSGDSSTVTRAHQYTTAGDFIDKEISNEKQDDSVNPNGSNSIWIIATLVIIEMFDTLLDLSLKNIMQIVVTLLAFVRINIISKNKNTPAIQRIFDLFSCALCVGIIVYECIYIACLSLYSPGLLSLLIELFLCITTVFLLSMSIEFGIQRYFPLMKKNLFIFLQVFAYILACVCSVSIPFLYSFWSARRITLIAYQDISLFSSILLYAGGSLGQTELFLSTEASLMKTNLLCIAAEFIVTFGLFSTCIVDISFKRNGRECADTLFIKEK
ncbi:hypothetical protein NEAUS03_0930 [Nematocida ausubeli]|nr:hypothetical protein NEAUS03_0930 [Nematocida ausubeli]